MKDTVIIYHGECPDGFGAAWAAHKKFGDNADYIPAHHNHPVPEGLVGKTVYLLDFAYPEDVMSKVMGANKRVTAIDHHFSREKAIKMTQNYSYASDHSGSVLSWMYFHSGKPVPKLLEYIEDRDLWKWKIVDSDMICTFIDSFSFDFKEWDKLVNLLKKDSGIKKAVSQGNLMLKHELRLMGRIIGENAKIVSFMGHDVYAVNAPGFFASHIGNALVKKKGPFAIVWNEEKDNIHVGLRSDGTIDVSKIAMKFGGGGHKASAGFDLPSISSFPWEKVE